MKALNARFFIMILSIMFAICAFAPAPESRWELIGQQDGVEFYVAHLPSASSTTMNTVVKAKNLNTYTVRVSFTPSIACDGINFHAQPIESTYLGADSDLSLYTYKACQGSKNVVVKILKVSVVATK